MSKKKLVAEYGCDCGTCVINGIGFNNGIGDGGYAVYYVEEKPASAEFIKDVWIDLRNNYPVVIHGYDCDKKDEERFGQKVLTKADFPGSEALQIATDDGDIYLVKYF